MLHAAVSYAQHPPALAQPSSSPRGVPVPLSQQNAAPESSSHPTCRIQTQSQPTCHVTIAKVRRTANVPSLAVAACAAALHLLAEHRLMSECLLQAVLPDQFDAARRSGSSTTQATQDAILTKDAAQLTVRQLCNIVLQSTFAYVEAVMGLPILEVFQVSPATLHIFSTVCHAAHTCVCACWTFIVLINVYTTAIKKLETRFACNFDKHQTTDRRSKSITLCSLTMAMWWKLPMSDGSA